MMTSSRIRLGVQSAVLRPESGAVAGLVAVIVIFTAIAPHFLEPLTLQTLSTVVGELGILSIGVTLLAIGGEFDLSIGSVLAFTGFILAWLLNAGVPEPLAVALALAASAAMGVVNGLMVVRLGITSFIATLAGQLLWRGLLLAASYGFLVSLVSKTQLGPLFAGKVLGGYDISVAWLIGMAAIGTVVLLRTSFGNWVFATGANRSAARAMGVPVDRVKLALFAASSLCAGLVGVIETYRFAGADPIRGTGVELQAITTMVIGGTLLTGGYGSLIGTILGVLIVAMVQIGLVLAGAPPYYFNAIVGIVLIAAVVTNLQVPKLARGRR